MAYIEYHLELRDHWKIERLREKLNIKYAEALGLVSCLWCWAGQQAQNGDLSKFTEPEIISAMRYEGENKQMKSVLKHAKLLEDNEKLHDWNKHGLRIIKSSRKRQKEYRKTLCNDNITVTSFFPSTLSLFPSLNNNVADVERWLEYKKEKRQTYKESGFRMLCKRLESIPTPERRKAAIENSMANNWAGIYEATGGTNAGTRKPNIERGAAAPGQTFSRTG